ncbi:MAG: TIGR00725 family protein [bacterium]|nr:TIGR00725 family protein [candidate division KSB1 bacterium]MDH7560174.1 TIGR00725 family protein [bacterium]
MERRPVVAVLGGAVCSQEISQLAYEVGRLIAEQGGVLICGGRSGVMEAACRGAQEHGGLTVGILPGDDAGEANPFVQIAIATGLGEARNVLIVKSADAAIAVDGGYGTLSEIAFCLKLGVPVVGVQTWTIDPGIHQAHSAAEAVQMAFQLASSRAQRR